MNSCCITLTTQLEDPENEKLIWSVNWRYNFYYTSQIKYYAVVRLNEVKVYYWCIW